ncbi:MAG: UDP-N-acetylmuramoyl-tripeptide--D-alanyl-D-alanine ligase [Pirellulales bacterium]|nr:UDP-N-acetylmuramoyl-tripeptide--D-alanyl-D-alanine ligase [Pirellulales bacterium]
MTTLDELNRILSGRLIYGGGLIGRADFAIGTVVADSRRIEPGDVFWALRDSMQNGANFVGDAFRRGAAGVVAERTVNPPPYHWSLQVDDAYRALVDFAAWKRRRFTGTLIAVTGSIGKTTTRQMIQTVLKTRLAGAVSPRNDNNRVGVPLSMLQIEPNHDYAVLGLGASRRGEIASLAQLCLPKVGVITQIGDAHLGGFGSRQAIAESKAELLDALPPDGRAVLGDDPWLRNLAEDCKAAVNWVGLGEGCDVHARDVKSHDGHLTFRVVTSANSPHALGTPFRIPVWGRHHVTAALAAIAVGRMMGFDLHEMADALEHFKPLPQRCEVLHLRSATVIYDAYSANPAAMRAALELLGDFDGQGRKIAVCGDMPGLGDEAHELHWEMGKQIVEAADADMLIACGEYARQVVGGAKAAGMFPARAIACKDVEEALPYLGQAILPGDVVLVKGSRLMAMERVVEALQQYPVRKSA